MLKPEVIREIARVCELKPSCTHREGAKFAQCSHQSFGKVKKIISLESISYECIEIMSDPELLNIFYPKVFARKDRQKRLPNKNRLIETRLKRKGKRKLTWTRLYLEYEAVDPKTAYGMTQFKFLSKQILNEYSASMKQFYNAGEVLFIDYAGMTVTIQEQGKCVRLFIFVAVLGYSKKMFAFATKGMKTRDWLYALQKALEWYGGVTEVVHHDNARALVSGAGVLPTLTESAKHFFKHYAILADTSRVLKSQDNGIAENAVKIVSYNILNVMQDALFTSHNAVNEHLQREIEKLNGTSFQGKNYSRDTLFYKEELPTLRPLPDVEFKYKTHHQLLTVPKTYLIAYSQHFYSVPHKLIGKQVELNVYNDTLIEIFYQHRLIAQHTVSKEIGGVTLISEHMPKAHRYDASKTKDTFLAWGREKGKAVETLIERQYDLTLNSRSRHIGKRCLALQQCCKKVGDDDFLHACEYCIERQQYYPTYVDMVARVRPWELSEHASKKAISHRNIRGAAYFGGHENG